MKAGVHFNHRQKLPALLKVARVHLSYRTVFCYYRTGFGQGQARSRTEQEEEILLIGADTGGGRCANAERKLRAATQD